MISIKACEIASVIGKSGGYTVSMNEEQIKNWYEHLIKSTGKQGYHRLSIESKQAIVTLNGIGCGIADISNRTGHTRDTVKGVLYAHSGDTLANRVKQMREYESSKGV